MIVRKRIQHRICNSLKLIEMNNSIDSRSTMCQRRRKAKKCEVNQMFYKMYKIISFILRLLIGTVSNNKRRDPSVSWKLGTPWPAYMILQMKQWEIWKHFSWRVTFLCVMLWGGRSRTLPRRSYTSQTDIKGLKSWLLGGQPVRQHTTIEMPSHKLH